MSLITTSPVPSIQGLSLYKMLPHVKENDVFPNLIFPYGSNSSSNPCGKPPSADYKVIRSSYELYVSIDLHVKWNVLYSFSLTREYVSASSGLAMDAPFVSDDSHKSLLSKAQSKVREDILSGKNTIISKFLREKAPPMK